MANFYETDRAVSEYLLFHYGKADQILPWPTGPVDALDFSLRCVTHCLDVPSLPSKARALDLGCAVGRSSFELGRFCAEVVGIDYSHRFVSAANRMKNETRTEIERKDEGTLVSRCVVELPEGIARDGIRFQQGDAMALPTGLGSFDVVLMANLIDRLAHPRRCLAQLPGLVNPGGQLIITSPYTWLEEYTAPEEWLGGHGLPTREALKEILAPDFELVKRVDLPFLIREHARKFQWSVAEATIWRRR